jgi:hypothetical protein
MLIETHFLFLLAGQPEQVQNALISRNWILDFTKNRLNDSTS